MTGRLAWVTTRPARGGDDDELLALAALDRVGVAVDVVDWDDTQVDWASYDRVVLRSTWDYVQRLPEFLRWLDEVDAVSRLVNPLAMVRWNLDKRYLADLAEAGVPTTPTAFVAPGEAASWPDGRCVVKPAVGAGSRDAAAYGPDQRATAEAHVARLHGAGQVVLVQPFVASVATDGEWALVFLDGVLSHAAGKRVALPRAGEVNDLHAAETVTAHVASAGQAEVARAAVDVVASRFSVPAYARVDLVRDDAGGHRVLEVELVEPSLFLPYAGPGAADRLAAALAPDVAGQIERRRP